MAHLWLRAPDSVHWEPAPLTFGQDKGDETAAARVQGSAGGAPSRALVPDIRRIEIAGRERWLLLASGDQDARVNGRPVHAGLCEIDDRDEIRLGGETAFYFSTERLASAEPLAASGRPIFCQRCKLEVEAGRLAVRCPSCGAAHHQCADLPCWSYDGTCSACPQPTAMDAGFRWSPEVL